MSTGTVLSGTPLDSLETRRAIDAIASPPHLEQNALSSDFFEVVDDHDDDCDDVDPWSSHQPVASSLGVPHADTSLISVSVAGWGHQATKSKSGAQYPAIFPTFGQVQGLDTWTQHPRQSKQ